MAEARFAYMLFNRPPGEILPWIAAELLLRERFARSHGWGQRLRQPYRIRKLLARATRTPFRQPQLTLRDVLFVCRGPEFRLHGLSAAPGFTLAEGFRDGHDQNWTYLPVTRACIHAEAQCFWLNAGQGLATFKVTGPGSGLRRVDHWREEDGTGARSRAGGTPHWAEGVDTGQRMNATVLRRILSNLDPALPKALETRAFSESWRLRSGFRGESVFAYTQQAEQLVGT